MVRYCRAMGGQSWIFGYGSLVWRPAFPYVERRPGSIRGFARRLWQRSTDHRGTPQDPGRVATLIEAEGAICGGMGYRVKADVLTEVLANLDQREQNGYRRIVTRLFFQGEAASPVNALVYVAGPDNPHYAGPAPIEEIAAIARRCRGPSGDNRAYVLELARALAELELRDPHVEEVAQRLEKGS